MTDNELLLAISELMDKKFKSELQPIKSDMQNMKADMQNVKDDIQNIKNDVKKVNLTLENIVIPRLDTIESCYIDTYKRYQEKNDKMDAVFDDVDLLKKVVTEHSEKLQKIS